MDSLLDQRITILENDVKEFKLEQKSLHQMHVETIVTLKVLQSKVNMMAAGIGMVSGIASSLIVRLLT